MTSDGKLPETLAVERILAEARKQARPSSQPGRKARPRLPSYEPFPVQHLPAVVRELVVESAAGIQCDPAMVAIPALVTIAGCIGNSCQVRLKKGWFEPAVLWGIVAADSGSGKSPAARAATAPAFTLQTELFRKADEATEAYNAEHLKWAATAKEERGDEPSEPPPAKRFAASDLTIEALAAILGKNPRGLVVLRDELDNWFQSLTRYKGRAGGTDRAQWLELFSAGTLIVDRKLAPGPLVIPRAAASLFGTIQPQILRRALDEESLAAGLSARFLLAMPPKRRKVWTDCEIRDSVREAYERLLSALLALPMKDAHKHIPRTLKLMPAAKRLWADFYDIWAVEQFNAEGHDAAALAKLEAYAARLGLVHHVVTCVANNVHGDDFLYVSEESMRAGIALTQWFRREAGRVTAMMGMAPESLATERLIAWVASHGGARDGKQAEAIEPDKVRLDRRRRSNPSRARR